MVVEIWSDMVCPWCFIGKRRFEQALAEFSGAAEVEVVHRAFQLDPGAATRGRRTVDVLVENYDITTAQAVDMMADVTDTAATVGLRYRLADTVAGNTADAHRLVLWAQDHGRGSTLLEALFEGYFEQARPVFTVAELLPFCEPAGLDPTAAAAMLGSDDYRDRVRSDQALAAQFGARGVPFFVFDRVRGVSGAQPVAVFTQALRG